MTWVTEERDGEHAGVVKSGERAVCPRISPVPEFPPRISWRPVQTAREGAQLPFLLSTVGRLEVHGGLLLPQQQKPVRHSYSEFVEKLSDVRMVTASRIGETD